MSDDTTPALDHADEPHPLTPSAPASARRVAANRRNARLSTGPRTVAGKRAVRHNPLKYGLTATDAIIPELDGPHAARDFNRLRSALRHYYDPTDPLSELDIDELTLLQWWGRRALRSLRSPVLKRLAATKRTRTDQASQIGRDVSVLATADTEALAASPETIESLRILLEDVRLEVETLGCISERARARLVDNFPVRPGGFVELCLVYSALAGFSLEPAKLPERPAELPSAEHCKAAILALIGLERDRLLGLKETLEAQEARQRDADQLAALCPETDDERIFEYYARFSRQVDRRRDRLDRQLRERRGQSVSPTLNVNLQGAE